MVAPNGFNVPPFIKGDRLNEQGRLAMKLAKQDPERQRKTEQWEQDILRAAETGRLPKDPDRANAIRRVTEIFERFYSQMEDESNGDTEL